MSLNIQINNRALWTATRNSRLSGSFAQHVHTSANFPFISPSFTSKPTSQRFIPTTHRAIAASEPSDFHVHKRRKYSSSAATPDLNGSKDATRRWAVQRDASGEHGESSPSKRHPRSSWRKQEYQDDSIVVTSSMKHHRDKEGRPWDVSASGQQRRKGKQNRLELRDLAVRPKQKREQWQEQKDALKEKFGEEGWNPRKKLSPDAMDGIRTLHEQDSERWSTPVLAEHFKVSPEAIRRILKSKWRPSGEQMEKRRERWARRHDRIWDLQAELGLRPQRTKDRNVEDPEQFEEELRAKQILDNARNA